MKRVLILIGLTLLSNVHVLAQQDIKIMQYNLLNYGNDFNGCNQTSNNIEHKNEQLQIIIDYVKPDIFCVNEIDASLSDVNHLMGGVLNINGVDYWSHATKSSNSYTMNMLYYNSDIFTLDYQENIYANPRQLDVYNLTHNASSIEFKVIVGHLKASEGSDNAIKRAEATQNLMDYLNNIGSGNYIFMGDFNFYSSSEQAFQNLTNYSNSSVNFYDPINRIGTWHNSRSFSDIHTQSTHRSSNGCTSTGGMDDRFDFILISEYIKNGSNNIEYLPNSYETIGQDGNHYNQAINDGSNNSAPIIVIDALYEMSDHVPVSLKLRLNTTSIAELENNNISLTHIYPNPSYELVNISYKLSKNSDVSIGIYDVTGENLYIKTVTNQSIGSYTLKLNVKDLGLKEGLYLVKINNSFKKLIIK